VGVRQDRKLTVQDYLEDWLQGKRNLRASTVRSYEYHVRSHLVPALGSIALQELRGDHIDALYGDLLSGRYGVASTAVVHHAHRVLRSALSTAVRRRLVQWNAAKHVELPQHRTAQRPVWTAREIAVFLAALEGDPLHPLFHTLIYTGMRRGEVLGLPWARVDFARAQLIIDTQLTDSGASLEIGPTKTRAGERVVPIDPKTVAILRDRKAAQDHERQQWGASWHDTGLVFTRGDGSFMRPSSVTHTFRRLVLSTGLPPLRLHDLRHTHASLALAAGIDIKVVSDRLGHSSTSITQNLYTRVVPAVARSAADAIAAAIEEQED
jgi:integrase